MISLSDQIVEGIRQEFERLNNSYVDTIVKEAYKKLPKGTYPKIIVEEIRNSEVFSRSTSQGERTTALGYQITTYSRDTEEYEYVDSVKYMMDVVDEYISKNITMRRVGDRVIKPYITDNTIMTCVQRYECVYDKDMDLIYKN